MKYINTTPHPITLADWNGENPFQVEPCGFLLNARVEEREVPSPIPGVSCVKTVFLPTPEGEEWLKKFAGQDDVIILGSIIAAQAYPGRVFALVPCQGYERVAPDKKRMRKDKFTIF